MIVSFALQLTAYRAVRCQRAQVLVRATTAAEVSGDDAGAHQEAVLGDPAPCAPACTLIPAWPAVRGPALDGELGDWAHRAPELRRPTRLDRPPRAA